ncbi:hypothetical protein BpHYR1_040081 [Brachionus plicatilis]|uniref:Uncharacterized protein n=1 Tax=Brachionus plicatilis TaxID=10195 RepID=A0A3M7RCV1_BRAPC|nr:hypothetical protein BpHYR1_040081 [Brachionus plicatilis]
MLFINECGHRLYLGMCNIRLNISKSTRWCFTLEKSVKPLSHARVDSLSPNLYRFSLPPRVPKSGRFISPIQLGVTILPPNPIALLSILIYDIPERNKTKSEYSLLFVDDLEI